MNVRQFVKYYSSETVIGEPFVKIVSLETSRCTVVISPPM